MMIAKCVRCGLTAFVLSICMAAVCLADTYYVRAQGNDRADGKSAKAAFRTFSRAAQVLSHGDSVVIGPGTYKEAALTAEAFGFPDAPIAITGDESGKLTGDQAGEVVIQPASGFEPVLSFQRVQYVVISGITFRGPGQGPRLRACREVVVERCTFDGLATGLSIEGCENVRVEASVFARCNIGANVRASVNTRLAHLTVAGASTVGVMINTSGAGTIRNCIFTANNTNLIGDRVSAAGWTSDCNVLQGTTGPWGPLQVTGYPAEWFAASGRDRHSVYVAPVFVAPGKFDLHIDPAVQWGGGIPGMYAGMRLDPPVSLDRDGKPIRDRAGAVSIGAYDYPDPRPTNNWRQIGKLNGPGPRQSAGVYKPDGTLVRMLVADAAGVRELWWDGLDDQGTPADAGQYQIRSATHDVRVVDDGSIGDNGSAAGTFNCDNGDRVVVLPDGGFVVATIYDEAGIPLRFHSSTGRSIFGVNLVDKEFLALALDGSDIVAAVMRMPGSKLERILLNGDRAKMANGSDFYSILSEGEHKATADAQARVREARAAATRYQNGLRQWEREKAAAEKAGKPFDKPQPAAPAEPELPPVPDVMGLAVTSRVAYVTLSGLNVLRAIDLATGQKKADVPVPAIGDVAADADGNLWVISGKEVLCLKADGAVQKRYATGLDDPRYVAAGPGRLAVSDRGACRIALLDSASGKTIRTFGKTFDPNGWTPRTPETFNDLRGMAFFPDGRLLIALHLEIRCIWPETGKLAFSEYSTFLDICAPHPQKPEYVYSRMGIKRVDPKTGSVELLAYAPIFDRTAYCSRSVMLGGRPFIAFTAEGITLFLYDVSDPLKPRLAFEQGSSDEYTKARFRADILGKDGAAAHVVLRTCSFVQWPFMGLDAQGNPQWNLANPQTIGPKSDPIEQRGITHQRGLAVDPVTGDFYYLAITPLHEKRVPAWMADGTGVAKTNADGSVPWFSLSSGGNYQSIASVHDGKNLWVLACKSFGGQIDVFDPDGLRLATGNWGWLCNYQMGFVDIMEGICAYMRADGKPGAYVEDDQVGRFVRARLDGTETLVKKTAAFDWPGGSQPGLPATAESAGAQLARGKVIPRVPELKVDGEWSAWQKAGVTPQIIVLPAVTWGRIWPPDLFETYKAGTAVGAFAHDGKNFYAYFLVTEDSPVFDSDQPGGMWLYDSIELWVEEEQFGLGFIKNGKPSLFKYRYHNREGKEWSANYPLPDDTVWGAKIADVTTHPLGKMLEGAVGAPLAGRAGYVMMARIPFDEIKLVGGIAATQGSHRAGITNSTGAPGEIIRIGVSFDGVCSWGREQDFKVSWPCGLMYSDPTRSVPFTFQ